MEGAPSEQRLDHLGKALLAQTRIDRAQSQPRQLLAAVPKPGQRRLVGVQNRAVAADFQDHLAGRIERLSQGGERGLGEALPIQALDRQEHAAEATVGTEQRGAALPHPGPIAAGEFVLDLLRYAHLAVAHPLQRTHHGRLRRVVEHLIQAPPQQLPRFHAQQLGQVRVAAHVAQVAVEHGHADPRAGHQGGQHGVGRARGAQRGARHRHIVHDRSHERGLALRIELQHQAHFEVLGPGRVRIRELEVARLQRVEGRDELRLPQRRVVGEVLNVVQRPADERAAGNRGRALHSRIRVHDDQAPVETHHAVRQLVEQARRRVRCLDPLGRGRFQPGCGRLRMRRGTGCRRRLDRQRAGAGGEFGWAGRRSRPQAASIK